MHRVKFNDYAELLSDDLNNNNAYLYNGLITTISDFIAANDCVSGLEVTAQAVPDMTVYVKSGRIYQNGYQGLLEADLTTPLTIAPASSNQPRIDLICAKYEEVEDEPEIRNVMTDVVSRNITQVEVKTRVASSIAFQVVGGTAAAEPTVPTTPEGWVALAKVTVPANTSVIQQSNIVDMRPKIINIYQHDHSGGANGAKLDYNNLNNLPDLSVYIKSINGKTPDGTGNVNLQTGLNLLSRSKAYQYGDIAYSPNLPSWAYLFCVTAGTTAASEPSFASVNTMGQYITDGTVKWIVDDVRFGLPVGVVFYDKKLRPGCVKINGATVQRSDYIRIFHDADEDDAFYDKDDTYTFTGTTTVSGTTITGISAEDIEKLQTAKEVCGDGILITGTGIADDCMIDTINEDSVTITVAATAAGSNVKISYGNIHNYPYLYGWGDGETTFVLPDYRARVIQGGDNILTLCAGLPEISGQASLGSDAQANQNEAGALTTINRSSPVFSLGRDGGGWCTLKFKASRSNAIYGAATTVQAPALQLIPQFKI